VSGNSRADEDRVAVGKAGEASGKQREDKLENGARCFDIGLSSLAAA
jgi:hypothetical protein